MAGATGGGGGAPQLAAQLADARFATAEYATDLEAAKADGYSLQITPNMPGMGFHFLNPSIGGEFDVTKPPILVYVKRGSEWQLAALEWVFTERPAKKPLKGARYGSFPAACHYADGSFVPAAAEAECAPTNGGCGVHVLASAPGDAARLALVSEPGRALRLHEPARGAAHGRLRQTAAARRRAQDFLRPPAAE